MTVSIIAAMDSKNGIGKGNDLLFRIPEDFQRMKSLTMYHPIIMGRKTFESIGKVLPGRTNIIITRNLDYKIEGAVVVDSIEKALRQAQGKQDDEIFIFGGGQVFKEALENNLVDKLYLTMVEGDFKADTFFPDYSNFKVDSEQEGQSGEYKYKFVNLSK